MSGLRLENNVTMPRQGWAAISPQQRHAIRRPSEGLDPRTESRSSLAVPGLSAQTAPAAAPTAPSFPGPSGSQPSSATPGLTAQATPAAPSGSLPASRPTSLASAVGPLPPEQRLYLRRAKHGAGDPAAPSAAACVIDQVWPISVALACRGRCPLRVAC